MQPENAFGIAVGPLEQRASGCQSAHTPSDFKSSQQSSIAGEDSQEEDAKPTQLA